MVLTHSIRRRRTARRLVAEERRAGRGVVVGYAPDEPPHPQSHESVTRSEIARRLAALKGYDFGGEYEAGEIYRRPLYFVPSDSIGLNEAHALGIRSEEDLFGGVVPHAFVATKTITHPLVDRDAYVPRGWAGRFADDIHDAVLRGYSAFTAEDALRAASRMLERGPVRVKPARAVGGRGQVVANDLGEVARAIEALSRVELATYGLALEENVTDVTTYSVGQVRVAGMVASYCGTQNLTTDNDGGVVYGGSDLFFVRGDFDVLLERELAPEIRLAVAQARRYDAAATTHFAGLLASRRNYDVVGGVDAEGRRCSGVLEQSWRIGGASGSEVAALEAFRADVRCETVRASCIEVYGESEAPPPEAIVYFRGVDEKVGLITKYTLTQPYVDA